MLGFNIQEKWQASSEFSKGMKLLEQGNYDDSLPHLELAYKLNKWDHYTVLNLAVNYLSINKFELALEKINEAVELSPKNPVAFLYKAFICLKMDKIEESESAIEACLVLDPKNPHCNYLKGMLSMKKNSYKDACSYFEKYTVFNKPEVFARILLASEIFLSEKMKDVVNNNSSKNDNEKRFEIRDADIKFALEEFYKGNDQAASDKIYEIVETKKFDRVLAKILLASELYFHEKNIEF